MVLRRWDPFSDMRRMQEAIDRMWRGAYPTAEEPDMERWSMPLDVCEEGDNILVEASLPGVKPEDIDITIKGATKTESERNGGEYLVRERRFGAFHRSLRLPNTVDTDRAAPSYEHGVLTITLPKADPRRPSSSSSRLTASSRARPSKPGPGSDISTGRAKALPVFYVGTR